MEKTVNNVIMQNYLMLGDILIILNAIKSILGKIFAHQKPASFLFEEITQEHAQVSHVLTPTRTYFFSNERHMNLIVLTPCR